MKVRYSWFDPDKTVVMLAGRRQHFWGFDKDWDQTSDWGQTCVSICCQDNLQSQGLLGLAAEGLLSVPWVGFTGYVLRILHSSFRSHCCLLPRDRRQPHAPSKSSPGQLLPLWQRPCPTLGQSSLSDSALLWVEEAGCALQKMGTFSGCCKTSEHRRTNSHSIYLIILVTPMKITESVRIFFKKNIMHCSIAYIKQHVH